MFHPRLIGIVTALVLLGSGPGRAEYNLSQLQAIEGLISSRNCEGLWLFVKSNPEIVDGDDPLANELRVFVTATERGQLDCFASRSTKSAQLATAPTVSNPASGAPGTTGPASGTATAPVSVPKPVVPVIPPEIY